MAAIDILRRRLDRRFTVIRTTQVYESGTKKLVPSQETLATGCKGRYDPDTGILAQSVLGQEGEQVRAFFFDSSPVLKQNDRLVDEATGDIFAVMDAHQYAETGHQEGEMKRTVSK